MKKYKKVGNRPLCAKMKILRRADTAGQRATIPAQYRESQKKLIGLRGLLTRPDVIIFPELFIDRLRAGIGQKIGG